MDLTPSFTNDPAVAEARLSMPLVEAMLTQRAVRRVLSDPVDESLVLRCIELALEAPSGSNGQNWEFVVVTDRPVIAAFGAQYRRAWALYSPFARRAEQRSEATARILRSVRWQVEHFEEIPVLVVCCLRGPAALPLLPRPAIASSSHYGSIYPSVQNLLLAARAMGLGAALITLPLWSTTVARHLLGLPLSVEPCCIVTLGWPRGRYGRKPRRPVGEVVHRNRFGERPWA